MDKIDIRLSAIDKKIESLIPQNYEGENNGGKQFVRWGDDDKYPVFLYDLYKSCPTLAAVIDGSVNFICGNDILTSLPNPNPLMTWNELIQKLATDYFIFGICYIQVVRNRMGQPSEYWWLDARYVRSDKKNQIFGYNEDYGKKYGRSSKTVLYPRFVKEAVDVPASVYFIKTPSSRAAYANPLWEPAVKSVVISTKIDTFHLGELENNFMASAIINFNNGIPSEEQADEIEKNVMEKFGGSENAGRFLLSFNNGKDNATTVDRLNTDDFADRYSNLAKETQNRIITTFGATPALFGIPTENNGFNSQEYSDLFKIYSRLRIKPIQKQIIDTFDYITNIEGSMSFIPYSLEDDDANKQDTIVQ